jgi:creatinine amidohydrolase
VAYGSSGEHAAFPGTLSIGADARDLLLVELIRSADAFAGVVLVSTHGGNAVPVSRAARRLVGEGRRVLAWSPPPGDPTDSHAGHAETSALLAVTPAAVRNHAREPGVSRPLRELMPVLARDGVAAVSASGVLGDPSHASAQAGRQLLDGWAAALIDAVDRWP